MNKAKLKKILKVLKRYPYTFLSKRAAINALKSIEKEKGKLSSEIINQCNKYAKDYLGDLKYAPWLYVYSAIRGEFKHGWIPDNYYGDIVVQDVDGLYSIPCELKPLSNRILQTDKLPDLLYINNGVFFGTKNYKPITKNEAFNLLFDGSDTVIFKNNDSSRGRGVQFLKKDEWNAEAFKDKSGVFQRIIKQHEFFNNIFPHPGATIRITTALDNAGKATVRAAYLRLGRSNDDSKHVQSSSAVKVAIDLNTGELLSNGYLADWRSTSFHPDTNVAFKGLVVPGFRAACTEIENLHNNYPFVQCIGWDVSINNNEQVEIMEWNAGHNDIKFSEAVQGPCFTDILERINSKAKAA